MESRNGKKRLRKKKKRKEEEVGRKCGKKTKIRGKKVMKGINEKRIGRNE